MYVRLHGKPRTYIDSYSDQELADWARKVKAWSLEGREVFFYFDNDIEGYAPHDARKLIAKLEERAA